jgi:hypothetical protein
MLCRAVLPTPPQATPVLRKDAEFGFPPWLFGMHSYEVLAGGKAVLAVFDDPAAAGVLCWLGRGRYWGSRSIARGLLRQVHELQVCAMLVGGWALL